MLVVGGLWLSERREPPAGAVASAPGSPEATDVRTGATGAGGAGPSGGRGEDAGAGAAADARPGT
ncbi:hypothetical protein ACM01_18795, partial [Streptomyces viridochromogenes]